ncbi:hypothetical protein D0962_37905 [Leptolyngbyaceae cyanobacterium CCMR0082]|uniref:Uncharacterized protein n=1 Tax=Adonisia turfae CCMR0082 TaxID=2304604 RepID=A0A6M0SIM1_9CYAN|nr:hypothetical protein [Adonisia turfae]NEZ68428.1 hypothetical protein [Adonisia turfae CCMR0082]
MTHLIKTLIRLIFLSVLWLLVRFTQFVLELSELIHEADAVSNAELHLQVKIHHQLKALTPKFIKA